jgi:hypothetical protein
MYRVRSQSIRGRTDTAKMNLYVVQVDEVDGVDILELINSNVQSRDHVSTQFSRHTNRESTN